MSAVNQTKQFGVLIQSISAAKEPLVQLRNKPRAKGSFLGS